MGCGSSKLGSPQTYAPESEYIESCCTPKCVAKEMVMVSTPNHGSRKFVSGNIHGKKCVVLPCGIAISFVYLAQLCIPFFCFPSIFRANSHCLEWFGFGLEARVLATKPTSKPPNHRFGSKPPIGGKRKSILYTYLYCYWGWIFTSTFGYPSYLL